MSKRWRIMMIKAVPPAMTRASSPYFSIKLKVFLSVVGSW
jgi:hypothetical protein